MVPPQAEDVPAAALATEASIMPPPPALVTDIEEVGTTAEASAPRAVMGTSDMAGPSGKGAVVAMDEDLAAPLSSESRDVVIPSAPGAVQVVVATSSLPAVEVPGPPPAAEALGPPTTTKVAETSSSQITLTTEKVMELATCRYIDFPGVGVIDLEGPQYSEKGYEAESERMSNALTIRETIASVSKALQEYERTSGFSSAAGAEAADAALVAPVAHVEPTVGMSTPLVFDEGLEAPPPLLAEATDAPAYVAEARASEAIVERKHHRRPVRLLLTPRASRFASPTSRPLSHKGRSLSRRRQEPPPRISRRPRGRERPCLRA
jgi:hypothetical protein